MTVTILGLYSYPVKSCAGIAHTESAISQSGLHMDRQWVIVNERGVFMTQRQYPRMALIKPSLHGRDLSLSAAGMPTLAISWLTNTSEPPKVDVRIWHSDTLGFDEGDEAAAWLSSFLEVPCRLLRVHPEAERTASREHVNAWRARHREMAPDFPEKHLFGFADGFPFLVANQASLDELNARLFDKGEPPVPMDRFRPNIVLQGLEPYEEDYLAGMRAGLMNFAFVKRCARCGIPNIDQSTAMRAEEPNLTLEEYRRFSEGVLFAVNAVVAGAKAGSVLRVGDTVEPEFDL